MTKTLTTAMLLVLSASTMFGVIGCSSGGGSASYRCDYFLPPMSAGSLPGLGNIPMASLQVDILDTYCPGGSNSPIPSGDPASVLSQYLTPVFNEGSDPNAAFPYYPGTVAYWRKNGGPKDEHLVCTVTFSVTGKGYQEDIWSDNNTAGEALCTMLQSSS